MVACEGVQTCLTRDRVRVKLEPATRLGERERRRDVGFRQPRSHPLGPLDHGYRIGAEVLGEARAVPFVRALQSIKIKMIKV